MITQDYLKRILNYDPETGVWTWAVRKRPNSPPGSVAGSPNPKGYRQIKIDGSLYLCSRLAFIWMNNEWPGEHVDHINMDVADNRWLNLRSATRSQNGGNRRAYSSNSLGVKGIFRRKSGKYHVQIQIDKKKIHLGDYDTLEKAASVYANAAKESFRDYHRTE